MHIYIVGVKQLPIVFDQMKTSWCMNTSIAIILPQQDRASSESSWELRQRLYIFTAETGFMSELCCDSEGGIGL